MALGRASPPPHGARPLVDQPRGFDLLRLPGLRRLLGWRYARFAFQLPLLVVAAAVIVDGLTGSQMAPRNAATTGVWIHYRGLVVLALALFGNAFCAACPLMLTRGATRWLKRRLPSGPAWPRVLRNKVLVLVLTAALLWAYEAFGLWASPWLTAWLAVMYFVAALAVDALFPAGTFCRYVCPLGNVNFVLSSVSPTQIAAADPDVCRACVDKPCLHGRPAGPATARAAAGAIDGATAGATVGATVGATARAASRRALPGCESGLMVPTITSNMDCTYCFNCVRACPYDNVALRLREPGRELAKDPWTHRAGATTLLFGVLLAVWGVMNALAMIAPFQVVADVTGRLLGTHRHAVLVLVLYVVVSAVGLVLVAAFALLADVVGGEPPRPWRAFRRWGYVVVALGFGFWTAHYLFHFLTGGGSAVPVVEQLLARVGTGTVPTWGLDRLVPVTWLFPVQVVVTALYAALAMVTAVRIGVRDFGRRGALAMWPMVSFALLFAALQILVLAQPMQMRGTMMMGGG